MKLRSFIFVQSSSGSIDCEEKGRGFKERWVEICDFTKNPVVILGFWSFNLVMNRDLDWLSIEREEIRKVQGLKLGLIRLKIQGSIVQGFKDSSVFELGTVVSMG